MFSVKSILECLKNKDDRNRNRAGLGGKREKRLLPSVIKLSSLAATFLQYLFSSSSGNGEI